MTISPDALMRADLSALRAAADRWARLGAALNAAYDGLIQAHVGLQDSWPSGPAAQAAHDRVQDLRHRLGDRFEEIDAIARARQAFADDIEFQRNSLAELVHRAERSGVRVDLVYGEVTSDAPAAEIGPVLEQYLVDIHSIAGRAGGADERARKIIDAQASAGQDDPPVSGPKGNDPSELLNLDPAGRRHWWREHDPVEQATMIAAYPEVVGGLDGLPTRDRDAANRIVLERQRSELQTRRQELAAQDGVPDAGERDLPHRTAEVDATLAAVAAVEHRLADPRQRLIGYRTGDDPITVIAPADKWDSPSTDQ